MADKRVPLSKAPMTQANKKAPDVPKAEGNVIQMDAKKKKNMAGFSLDAPSTALGSNKDIL